MSVPDLRAAVTLPARERMFVLGGLSALVALAWAYLWLAPMPMPAASGGLRTVHYAAFTFAMWLIMMVGMMLPSVAPTVLLFDRIQRRWRSGEAFAYTMAFVAGYLVAWLGFSAVATWLQIELIARGWVDDMGVITDGRYAALLLTGLALYQWAPAKRACLDHCRSPAEYLATRYRPGLRGAVRTGLYHGLYCLGCCWALMLLLFIGGVMNLLWVAAIAALVFAEKLLARGEWLRRAIGIAAILGALAFLVR